MLPGLGFQEVVVLAVIALLVVGPRDLPLMLRKLGRFTARLRSMANEFRSGMDELARQAELDELKREVENLRRGQVFTDIAQEVRKPISLAPVRSADPPASPPPLPDPSPEVPEPTPEIPPAPDQPTPVYPPTAPPEVPPISPPPPMGPEPIQAAGGRM